MAGVCSPVRRAGRLHFIGRHLEDRHYDPPQFEVGSARHRRGHGVAYRWPAGMPRVDSDEAASGARCPTPHVPLRRPASSALVLLVRPRRISAAVSLSFDARAPLEKRAMNITGSQRRADKWTEWFGPAR